MLRVACSSNDLTYCISGLQPTNNLINQQFEGPTLFAFQCAFPEFQDSPIMLMQQSYYKFIHRDIFGYLFPPEGLITGGPFKEMAVMAVPETAMNQDYSAVTWQNNVWLAGQPLVMQAIA
jgi:hypothetical protein